jgi:hypothetical protein
MSFVNLSGGISSGASASVYDRQNIGRDAPLCRVLFEAVKVTCHGARPDAGNAKRECLSVDNFELTH